jgi:carbonic anhydrase
MGNSRFVSGVPATVTSAARRAELAAGQAPSTIVVGCSDSRVPPEIIFDQPLGELFVIRVAGNTVASSQVGSVEFAAEQLGARLVVVLGHSRCGAVMAALEAPPVDTPNYPRSIVDRVLPALEVLLSEDRECAAEELLARAVRANITHAAAQLRQEFAAHESLGQGAGLLVVGAEYSLTTGEVEFFDGLQSPTGTQR